MSYISMAGNIFMIFSIIIIFWVSLILVTLYNSFMDSFNLYVRIYKQKARVLNGNLIRHTLLEYNFIICLEIEQGLRARLHRPI